MTKAERMAEIKARCYSVRCSSELGLACGHEESAYKNRGILKHFGTDIPYLLARVDGLEALVEAAYCEGYEDSKDHGSHWSNSVSRAALEGEDNG